MATFINVTAADAELLRRNRDQVQGNRLQKVEGDEQGKTAAGIKAQQATQPEELAGWRRRRAKLDQPAASRTETAQIGLWKTGITSTENVGFEYKGWFGIRFTAARPFTINYLGSFDNLENGLQVAYPIRLWRARGDDTPAIIFDGNLAQGSSGWFAGGYRFTQVPPISVLLGDVITVVIFYLPQSESDQQEDRYQFCVTDDPETVATSNPQLFSTMQLVESMTDDDAEYPSYTRDIIEAVNVNIATSQVANLSPYWAQS
jgi:hypothetical protein